MKELWKGLTSKWSGKKTEARPVATPTPPVAVTEFANPEQELWQRVHDARQAWLIREIGPVPDDILKIGHMTGVWPGGGLYVIPAEKAHAGTWLYTTFGFTNPDMPTTVTMTDVTVEKDDLGRPVRTSGKLQSRPRATAPEGAAGYGYEFAILADENTEWPLWVLQWAASAEMANDVGFLARVEKYQGLTISDIRIGKSEPVNLLIAKARPPFPSGTTLPNGKLELLIATVITAQEMKWSFENGREALLDRLFQQGYDQVSQLHRPSVVS